MTALGLTAGDLGAALAAIAEPDLFGHRQDPAVLARRLAIRRRLARGRRRDAVAAYLAEPWTAWSGTDLAARIARRYLLLHPERDRPDPDHEFLTDRQAAALFHAEEEAASPDPADYQSWPPIDTPATTALRDGWR